MLGIGAPSVARTAVSSLLAVRAACRSESAQEPAATPTATSATPAASATARKGSAGPRASRLSIRAAIFDIGSERPHPGHDHLDGAREDEQVEAPRLVLDVVQIEIGRLVHQPAAVPVDLP